MKLNKIYHPITATPFARSESYMEWEPCRELKPYIRCFWGSEMPYIQGKNNPFGKKVITPDTCVDVIFNIDFTNNQIKSVFCGIDDRTFVLKEEAGDGRLVSCFAIRFYAWAAILFSEESMRESRNSFFQVDHHFSRLKKAVEPLLFDLVSMKERVERTEQFLLQNLHMERANPIVMDAVWQILRRRGNLSVGRLSGEVHASNRTLERLFQENIGISPKRLASLVRYQYLWQDILCKLNFSAVDAAYQYGYSDQAHLAHDFKRFHAMSMAEARRYALDARPRMGKMGVCS